MFDTELANDNLTLACDKGADFAEIFAENNQKSSISLINGRVEKGIFGADMKVTLENDGPFTVMLECKNGEILL